MPRNQAFDIQQERALVHVGHAAERQSGSMPAADELMRWAVRKERAEKRDKEEAERRARAEEEARRVVEERRERQARADDVRRQADRRELVCTPGPLFPPIHAPPLLSHYGYDLQLHCLGWHI